MLSNNQFDIEGVSRHTSLSSKVTTLDFMMSNICNIGCIYCDARHSSVLAELFEDQRYSKKPRKQAATDTVYQQSYQQFINQTQANIDQTEWLTFSGGEVTVEPDWYRLLDSVVIKHKKLTICTNLNTPQTVMPRLLSLMDRLIADGNQIQLRTSLDGIGTQQEWQRWGSDWSVISANWTALGSRNLLMQPVLTVTPLTLESMCDLARWVISNCHGFFRKPKWIQSQVVIHPHELSPIEWFGAFHDDIACMIDLLQHDSIEMAPMLRNQMTNDWYQKSSYTMPSSQAASRLTCWLDARRDLMKAADWRNIYPRVAELARTVQIDTSRFIESHADTAL
jgi:hypothetical protein